MLSHSHTHDHRIIQGGPEYMYLDVLLCFFYVNQSVPLGTC